MPAVIVTDIWQWTPFMFILFLAGLQSLPRDPVEAAEVDGATGWQVIRLVKLPLLAPVIWVAVILRIIDAFRSLEVMFIMTFGGPGRETEVLSLNIYKTAFMSQRLGLAAVNAVFLGLHPRPQCGLLDDRPTRAVNGEGEGKRADHMTAATPAAERSQAGRRRASAAAPPAASQPANPIAIRLRYMVPVIV
jgi:hypothetical protein